MGCTDGSGNGRRGLIALGVLVKPYVGPALASGWRPWDWKMPLAVIAAVALCYLPYLSVGSGVFGFLTKGYLTEEGIISGYDLGCFPFGVLFLAHIRAMLSPTLQWQRRSCCLWRFRLSPAEPDDGIQPC